MKIILRLLFECTLVILLVLLLIGAGIVAYLMPTLPNGEELADVRLQVPLRVYSHDGSLISQFGEKRRLPLTIDQFPEQAIQAALAAEDSRFFDHIGVDWQGLLRATFNLIKTGRRTQGGSTITMQVAKNYYLDPSRTYKRKIREILLAFKLEQLFDKNKILELYLNKIFYGNRAYGIAAAAETYYGMPLGELSLAQIAMLTGIPQHPSINNPVRSPRRAQERRGYVLRRMLELGYITQAEYKQADTVPVTASLHSPPIALSAPYVAEMVRTAMIDKYGQESALSGGFSVYTTLNKPTQHAADLAVREALLEYDRRHGWRGAEAHYPNTSTSNKEQWKKWLSQHRVVGNLYPALVVGTTDRSVQIYLAGLGESAINWDGLGWAAPYMSKDQRGPPPTQADDIVRTGDVVRVSEAADGTWQLAQIPAAQGAIVAVQPDDGALLALTGGFDFQLSQFNRATEAQRQPGSGFKPFLYSAALESGLTAASLINDAPVVYKGIGQKGTSWKPKNYSGDTKGQMRMREALVYSRNLVSIRLLDQIGIPFAKAYLQRFGFDVNSLPDTLSLALGSGETTLWNMARAYSVIANGGYLIEPYFINRIEKNGFVVYQNQPQRACHGPSCRTYPASYNKIGLPVIFADTDDSSSQAPLMVNPTNAWLVTSMMQDVIRRGTGVRARVLERDDLSGKTGTTNDQRDAWFFGFNASVTAVCWVGFDDYKPLGRRETGAKVALPLWIKFMRNALPHLPEARMTRPDGLVDVRVDAATGDIANHASEQVITETFRVQNIPTGSTIAGPTHKTEEVNPRKSLF